MGIFKEFKVKDYIFLFIIVALVVGQVWLDLKIPNYMSEITVLVQSGVQDTTDIWIAGGKMLACALGSAIFAIIVGYFCAVISGRIGKRMRDEIYSKVQSFGMNEIHKFSIPSLITRSTNDISQVQFATAVGMQVIIKAPIMSIWAICTILGKSWAWSLATACAVIILLVVIAVIVVFALPKFKKIQTLTDNLNRVTRENITGLRVVRAYNAEDFEANKFEKANEELNHTNLVVNRLMALLSPVMMFMISALSLAIYWIGAYLINSVGMAERLTVFGDMVVFMSYAMLIVMSFVMLTMVFIILPRAMVAFRRVKEVCNTELSIHEISESKKAQSSEQGVVEFRNVSFKYPNAEKYILRNVSFKVNKGETIAFIGSTGSGKSTLINLVPRFYDCTEGEVLVDGVNVKDYTHFDLMNKIAYVSQKAVLFSGTIKSNITYGENDKEEVSDELMEKVLRISQADEFVYSKEKGVDSEISQGGANVSGGQKQRLSIARALARDAEICIFDDSFSALDYRTDKNLRKALKEQMPNLTKLIVAQRIATIQDADKIVVLDSGDLVGYGTHDELMQSCDVYKEIALSQFSQSELGLDDKKAKKEAKGNE